MVQLGLLACSETIAYAVVTPDTLQLVGGTAPSSVVSGSIAIECDPYSHGYNLRMEY